MALTLVKGNTGNTGSRALLIDCVGRHPAESRWRRANRHPLLDRFVG